jgi:hypothetical protein
MHANYTLSQTKEDWIETHEIDRNEQKKLELLTYLADHKFQNRYNTISNIINRKNLEP